MDLNLPSYEFKIVKRSDKEEIFDIIRKKYVVLSPEEWVRQHLVWFLIHEKSCPAGLMSVENGLTYNRLKKRADIVVRDRQGGIFMIVEVKAPHIKLDQDVLNQVASYHRAMPAKYLLISNGLEHFCLKVCADELNFVDHVPVFGDFQ